LREYAGRCDLLVLGLARGGVPVGFEIAKSLRVPLDVFVVRKLGLPQQPELAMGAIASGGIRVLNQDVIGWYHVPQATINAVAKAEAHEVARREELYRGGRLPVAINGRIVVLADDGLATGSTMRAAVEAVRQSGPARTIVAVPVGAAETVAELRHVAEEVVCIFTPQRFSAVGEWYEDFSQTTDDDVARLLRWAVPVGAPDR
jgi:predicted phosphoribosyltransferase